MNAEVYLLLEDLLTRRQQEQQKISSSSISAASLPSSIIVPALGSSIFLKTLDYLREQQGGKFRSNREILREIRQLVTNDFVLSEFEMAQLGNLLPNTSEEAKFYIPSLRSKVDDDSLQRLLDDLSSFINQQ